MQVLSLVVLGLVLGLRHATDADHVVAVATIVSRQQSLARASKAGLLWGLGHTVTIILVGGAIILLHVVVPPRLGLSMEFAVAVMLVLLGIVNLTTQRGNQALPTAWPFYVGLVHGLAGSAAVALLVLTAIREPAWAIAYLLVFCGGTVCGMTATTLAMAGSMRLAAGRFVALNSYLRFASGALSLAFGLALAYQIGVVQGLFSASPSWTPR